MLIKIFRKKFKNLIIIIRINKICDLKIILIAIKFSNNNILI